MNLFLTIEIRSVKFRNKNNVIVTYNLNYNILEIALISFI